MKKTIISALALSIAFSGASSVMAASGTEPVFTIQDKEKAKPKGKRVEAMSPETGKLISKVAELYEVKDFQSALDLLLDLKKKHDKGKLKGIDSATMFQFIGTLYYEMERTDLTIKYYEEYLKYKANVTESQYLNILYNVGQLKFMAAMDLPEGASQKRAIDDVKVKFKEWERASAGRVKSQNYYFLSQVYLATEDYTTTLAYIDKTIAQAAIENATVKEAWYSTRFQSYFALEDYSNVVDTLLTMINTWPKPKYWRYLAAAFSQNNEDKKFFSVTEINYESGFFERAGDYTNMAQIYFQNEVPIKAAWVLEGALKDGILEDDETTLGLLGNAYLASQEYTKAIDPVSKTARLKNDWKLWMQVGQIQQSMAEFRTAETSFDEALAIMPDRESLEDERFTLLTLKANTQTELHKFADAKRSLDEASKLTSTSKQRKSLKSWRTYLKNSETRWDMLNEKF